MTETLNISNGTTTISFLDNSAIKLIEWLPAVATPEIISRESNLSDFQAPIRRNYKNIVETFRLYIVGASQDVVAGSLNSLLALLEDMVLYHTTENQLGSIGYITAKSDSETNTRYAPIYNYRLEQIPQVFQDSPFKVGALSAGVSYGSALEEIVLVIERGHWTDAAPWTGTAIQVSSQFVFNSATYGQEATTGKVYAANKSTVANISHIFRYDASLDSYSANLVTETAYNLFPSSTALNDAIYFGCQTSITDSGPFNNLVFDIGTVGVGTYSAAWEYYDGGGWSGFSVVDDTDAVANKVFSNSGVNSVWWNQPSEGAPAAWPTVDINGVTAYWIRCRISDFTSMSTIPAQQNRRVYSQTAPYIQIDTAQKGGTLSPKAIIRIDPVSGFSGIVGGFRSTDRGTGFSAYFNWADEQNVTGITFDEGTAFAVLTLVEHPETPTGWKAQYALGATADTPFSLAQFTVGSAVATDYAGKFRVFLRGDCMVSDQFWVQIEANDDDDNPVVLSTSGAGSFPDRAAGTLGTVMKLLDLGLITIPKLYSDFFIKIYTERVTTTAEDPLAEFWDLILIPADEYVFAAYSPAPGGGASASQYLLINGSRETEQYAAVCNTATNAEKFRWVLLANTGPTMNTKTQRLWLTYYNVLYNSYKNYVSYQNMGSITIQQSKRYLSLRGSG